MVSIQVGSCLDAAKSHTGRLRITLTLTLALTLTLTTVADPQCPPPGTSSKTGRPPHAVVGSALSLYRCVALLVAERAPSATASLTSLQTELPCPGSGIATRTAWTSSLIAPPSCATRLRARHEVCSCFMPLVSGKTQSVHSERHAVRRCRAGPWKLAQCACVELSPCIAQLTEVSARCMLHICVSNTICCTVLGTSHCRLAVASA